MQYLITQDCLKIIHVLVRSIMSVQGPTVGSWYGRVTKSYLYVTGPAWSHA
jgi:hypothetical protein